MFLLLLSSLQGSLLGHLDYMFCSLSFCLFHKAVIAVDVFNLGRHLQLIQRAVPRSELVQDGPAVVGDLN